MNASLRAAAWGPAGRPIGVAHRGAPREAPENTLAAFRRALGAGAAAVECDVQRTRDGRLVVIHDQTIERTTDGRGAVADLTFADLRALDAGAWFGPAFAGERVPLLDEVLELVRGRARILIEIKNGPVLYHGIELELTRALRNHGMERAALVMSFDHAAVRAMRNAGPEIATAIVYDAGLLDPVHAARLAAADAICPRWRLLTVDAVARAHAAGLGVFPWTVDDEASARRCLDWGADGVTSNDVRLLARLIPDTGGMPG